jgi:hypothetical protein
MKCLRGNERAPKAMLFDLVVSSRSDRAVPFSGSPLSDGVTRRVVC